MFHIRVANLLLAYSISLGTSCNSIQTLDELLCIVQNIRIRMENCHATENGLSGYQNVFSQISVSIITFCVNTFSTLFCISFYLFEG